MPASSWSRVAVSLCAPWLWGCGLVADLGPDEARGVDAASTDGRDGSIGSGDSGVPGPSDASVPLDCDGSACPAVCVPGWWGPGFSARRPLVISEATAGTLPAGYSVVARLDTSGYIGRGQMRADGADLRVLWSSGGMPIELHRHVLGLNGADTEVWFKTQADIDGTDSSYALVWGNPSAGAPPEHWQDGLGAFEPSQVYLSADDFEDTRAGSSPRGWVGSSEYRIELDGANHVLAVNGADTGGKYIFAGDDSWTDVVVRARLRILETGASQYGLFARAEGASDIDSVYYGFQANDQLTFWYCTMPSPDATSNSCEHVRDWTIPAAGQEWHVLEMRLLGQEVELRYDGTRIDRLSLTSGRTTRGRIGCDGAYGNVHGFWDDFIVRPLVVPEPQVTAGGPCPAS